jgi:hypothetical protein
MRDNHDGCPELLDAYERDGFYFGSVGVTIANEVAAFEFGIEQSGYISLKQILQTRPFDTLGKHRYFFTGSFSRREPGSDAVRFDIRIEQGANGQKFKGFPRARVAGVQSPVVPISEKPSGCRGLKTAVVIAMVFWGSVANVRLFPSATKLA